MAVCWPLCFLSLILRFERSAGSFLGMRLRFGRSVASGYRLVEGCPGILPTSVSSDGLGSWTEAAIPSSQAGSQVSLH